MNEQVTPIITGPRNGEQAKVWWQGRQLPLSSLLTSSPRHRAGSVFYIPAQRVLALRDGWPQPFSAYSSDVPFVLREFSETLRVLMGQFNVGKTLFPEHRRLSREFRGLLKQNIFAGFKLVLQTKLMQMRLVLKDGDQSLPFMVWSSGQREFVPLLLGLYWLMLPSSTGRRGEIKWVVLEELEMGLHPRAIETVATHCTRSRCAWLPGLSFNPHRTGARSPLGATALESEQGLSRGTPGRV